jgi:hypothetical protein
VGIYPVYEAAGKISCIQRMQEWIACIILNSRMWEGGFVPFLEGTALRLRKMVTTSRIAGNLRSRKF